MNRNLFLLIISIFEIIRWVIIYLFLNYVKTSIDPSSKIIGEGFLWFGSAVFLNLLFAVAGILCFFDTHKYLIMMRFWYVFKIFFVVFIVFLLFQNIINLRTYFLLFAPFDFFIFLYLMLFERENSRQG